MRSLTAWERLWLWVHPGMELIQSIDGLQASRLQQEHSHQEKQVSVMDADRKQLQQQLTMLQQALNGWEKLHAGKR